MRVGEIQWDPSQPWLEGLAELPCRPKGQWGQDVAMVRLSPEKGHSDARVCVCVCVRVCRNPMLADGCLSSPPTSSSALLLGELSPW